MSTPTHPSPVQITQARHPWRSTVRTVVAYAIPAAAAAPEIYHQATQHDPSTATGLAGAVLAGAGAITRVLAIPAVEAFLRKRAVTSWLAAAPAAK